MNIVLSKLLKSKLEKGRKPLPIGTIRIWGDQKYAKHVDGWVAVGGEHHGKYLRQFKTEKAPQAEFANKYLNTINTDIESGLRKEANKEINVIQKEEFIDPRELQFSINGKIEFELPKAKKETPTLIDLQKQNPSNFVSILDEGGEPETVLAMHYAIQSFPKTIEDSKWDNRYLDDIKIDVIRSGSSTRGFEDRDELQIESISYREAGYSANVDETISMGEFKKRLVDIYKNAYIDILSEAEKLAKTEKDYKSALSKLYLFTDKYEFKNIANHYTHVYDRDEDISLLDKFKNDFYEFRSGLKYKYKKRSTSYRIHKFQAFQKYHNTPKLELKNSVSLALQGKTVEKIFEEKKIKKISILDKLTDKTIREGFSGKLESPKEQFNFLKETSRMKEVQWGRSMSKDEITFHLDKSSNAFKDLVDTLELPLEMASFNGRLSLNVGVRGKRGALAHYQPGLMLMNLTRENGVGSLAHEWGHFFDDILCRITAKKYTGGSAYRYFSEIPEEFTEKVFKNEADKKMASIMISLKKEMNGIAQRMFKTQRFMGLSRSDKKYYSSTSEMFARCFSNYLYDKLELKGQKNTYLVKKHNEWNSSNKEETKKITQLFDKLFYEFRTSELLKKALYLLENNLIKGKKFPIGTQRTWGGKDYKKVSEGKWEEVKKIGTENTEKQTNTSKKESSNKINQLNEEAKKWDSAEAFIDSFPKVFRSGSLESGNPAGIFLSKEKEIASMYEDLSKQPIKEYYIDKNAKIKEATTRDELLQELDSRFNDVTLINRLYAEEFKAIKETKKQGLRGYKLPENMTARQRYETKVEQRIAKKLKGKYDGVLYNSEGRNDQVGEYQIFNKDIIKTAEQLIDIWEKANKSFSKSLLKHLIKDNKINNKEMIIGDNEMSDILNILSNKLIKNEYSKKEITKEEKECENIKFLKSILIDNILEKGKKYPIGTIRIWGNKGYKKVAEGDWKEVSNEKMRNQALEDLSNFKIGYSEAHKILDKFSLKPKEKKELTPEQFNKKLDKKLKMLIYRDDNNDMKTLKKIKDGYEYTYRGVMGDSEYKRRMILDGSNIVTEHFDKPSNEWKKIKVSEFTSPEGAVSINDLDKKINEQIKQRRIKEQEDK